MKNHVLEKSPIVTLNRDSFFSSKNCTVDYSFDMIVIVKVNWKLQYGASSLNAFQFWLSGVHLNVVGYDLFVQLMNAHILECI